MARALIATALAAIIGLSIVITLPDGALADDGARTSYRKRKPQVRGFVARRGGYSYVYADSLDTYGNARTVTGGSRFYRDSYLDRQTRSGPFDHGFFYDSSAMPRGGDSPYMH